MTVEIANWGAIAIPYASYRESSFNSNVARLTQSPEGQRDSQAGIVKAMWSTFHSGGMRPKIQLGAWSRDLDKQRFNQGLQTHIPYFCGLPWLLQLQSQIASGPDLTGLVNGNKRVHEINTVIVAGVLRYYSFINGTMFRETSTSDHSLVVATTSGLYAGKQVSAVGMVRVNSVDELCIGMAQTPNAVPNAPILGTTDPTAATAAFTGIGAAPGGVSSFSCWGVCYLNGIKFNIATGSFPDGAGVAKTGIFYINDVQARATSWNQMLDALTGAILGMPLGGVCLGPAPFATNQIWGFGPQLDEEAGGSSPRRGWKLTCTPISGTVLDGTLNYPSTDHDHIRAACYFLGGVAWAGMMSAGSTSTRVTLTDADGVVRDMNFPGVNGSGLANLLVAAMWARGKHLYVRTYNTDMADVQDWIWVDGSWHADGSPLWSKAATLGASVMLHAEAAIGANQSRRYGYQQNASTSTKTDVLRIFTPPDPSANPLLTDTAEKKHYGALYLEGLELDYMGPVEANKAFTRLLYANHYTSVVSGAYGTAKVDISVDQGSSFTAISNTFDSDFEIYNVPAAGVAFRTAIPRLTLDNGSTNEGNAETSTPQPLPLVFEAAVLWPKLSVFELEVVVAELPNLAGKSYTDITAFTQALKTQENVSAGGKPVQRFTMLSYDIPAVFESYSLHAAAGPVGARPSAFKTQPIIVLRQVPGVST